MSDEYLPPRKNYRDWFEEHGNSRRHGNCRYLRFVDIPVKEVRHPRQDLCGLIYLSEKLGSSTWMPIISSISGSRLILEACENDMDRLAEEDVIYLLRCGIHYEHPNLVMYVC